jgi:prepilin-type N-terminal cleavage/methylation domain-containing protein
MGPIQGRETARQDGVTLIEILISIVIIALVVGSATTGLIVLNWTTAQANDAARANVIANGFGDALKRLPYLGCTSADLGTQYEDAFEQAQNGLVESRRLLKPGESVQITRIEVAGSTAASETRSTLWKRAVNPADAVDTTCPAVGIPVDPGVQTISYEVTSRSKTRTAEVSKRNPDYADGLFPSFTACRVTTLSTSDDRCLDGDEGAGRGDALAVFELDASATTPLARIIQFSFACNDDDNTVITVTNPTDPSALCEYRATNAVQSRAITMTLTDTAGRTAATSVPVTIPPALDARLAPDAEITATCAACSSVTATSATGTANPGLVVNFSAANSVSLQGSIVKYEWDFGDVNSGAANTATGVTASHTFTRTNNHTVTLTVTDDVGVTGTATFSVVSTRTGPPPPVASFTFSPSGGVSPQTVTFNPSGSSASVVSYLWSYGNGQTSTEVSPSYQYTSADTYTVTLTVTDGTGTTASTTRTIVISAFTAIPPNFRMTDAVAGGLLGVFYPGRFFFAWTNVARSSEDLVEYEVQLRHESGICFGFNTESRRVPAGQPGTNQTWEYRVPGSSDVCIGNTYGWRVRSHRSNLQGGSTASDWTDWRSWTVTRTAF